MSIDIETSKDGYRVLKIDKNNKKVYLGSKYNQKREIDKFNSKFNTFTIKDNFIVLGLSFGEHIKELLKLISKYSRILIVEFDNEVIEYCKNDAEVKKILENEKIIIANSIDEVEKFIQTYISEINIEKLKVSSYCNYDQIYLEQSKEIYTLIRNYFAKIKINRNTYETFGELFLSNSLSNLKYIAKSTEINQLENAYKDKPAIIVSAGPSLIKNIGQLKDIDNALILTGGRTLGPLLEREIKPTCLGVVDPGEAAYHQVAPYIRQLEIPLIFTDLTNDKIIKEHNAKKYFYTDNMFIAKALRKNIKCLYGGGSIAHTMTNLAVYMGCNPIIFIGQDLAYTGDKGHADFCAYRPFEQYKDSNDIYVKDIYGDKVRTSLLLNEYRINLEKIIKESPHIKFINATEGGANIEGAENIKLEEVLKCLENEKLNSMDDFWKEANHTQNIIHELEDNLELTKEYIKLCKNAQRYLKNYKNNYLLKNQKGVDDSIRKLNEIDEEIINKNTEMHLISTVIVKTIHEIENNEDFIIQSSDSKYMAFNKEVSRSEALYSNIKIVLDMCYENIEKTINELKKEC